MQHPDYDLCVIGGGINGAGIARDAAGRGLSVLLVEAGDLASATSSASTKLVHGGLRYLEYLEFGLVRESLREREALLRIAPHVIRPMEFILPHDKYQRPYAMIRAGLMLYDRLGGRKKLRSSGSVTFHRGSLGDELQDTFIRGVRYYDCWADDSRLVVLNAMDAARKGAEIMTRTTCTKLAQQNKGWRLTLFDSYRREEREVTAAMVVNATGPWVRGMLESAGLAAPQVPRVRLVKGSHIIIPRAFDSEHAWILQQGDKRVVFVIPYENNYTMIGTTEVDYSGDPSQAAISDLETDYLCNAFNSAFKKQIQPKDCLWTFAGVRPLFDDGKDNSSAVSRDYRIYHHSEYTAPLLSIFGGKLTTYRMLAEKTVTKLMDLSGHSTPPWTATEPLPGGNIPDGNLKAFIESQQKRYPWLPDDLVVRYAKLYGTYMDRFLDGSDSLKDLGRHFGDHVYEAEIVYLVRMEWARSVEDILWRRTKLGVHVGEATVRYLETSVPGIVSKEYSKDEDRAARY